MTETKSELRINAKEIAVPGETLAVGMDYLPSFGTYRAGDEILASRLGLVNIDGKVIKLVPLSGKYLPQRGDTIIVKVTEILMSGWRVDTASAYSAVLPLKDASSEFIARGANLSKYFGVGDCLVAKVTNVTSQNLVDITMRGPGLRKLKGGRLVLANSFKIPRIIGKKGSMVTLIKEYTQTKIIVGQNGLIWVSGDNPSMELLAVKTIKKIEKESHLAGLTDKIKKYLENETKGE